MLWANLKKKLANIKHETGVTESLVTVKRIIATSKCHLLRHNKEWQLFVFSDEQKFNLESLDG